MPRARTRHAPELAALPEPDRSGEPAACFDHRIAPLVSRRGGYANGTFCCIAARADASPTWRRASRALGRGRPPTYIGDRDCSRARRELYAGMTGCSGGGRGGSGGNAGVESLLGRAGSAGVVSCRAELVHADRAAALVRAAWGLEPEAVSSSEAGSCAANAGNSGAGSGGAGACEPHAGSGGAAAISGKGGAGDGVVDPVPSPAARSDAARLGSTLASALWQDDRVVVVFDSPLGVPRYITDARTSAPVSAKVTRGDITCRRKSMWMSASTV